MNYPTGRLDILVRLLSTGEIVETRTYKNLVVDNFGNQAVYLVGGENLVEAAIDRVGLGVGVGTGSGSVGVASVTDTSLTNPPTGEVSAAVSSVVYNIDPDTGLAWDMTSVTFTATFGSDDANGIAFTEAGLLFAGVSPNLATHRVFDAMIKSSLFSWTFGWTLRWQ